MRNARSSNGYALVTTMLIGFFSILFLMALSAAVTSAVRSVSANQFSDSLRNAAEIGIEYAVSQYNTYPTNCPIDPVGLPAPPVTVPTAYLQSGTANSGIPNVTVTVNISYIPSTSPLTWANLQANSPIYKSSLDPSTNATNQVVSFGVTNPSPIFTPANVNGYRIIESTASNGFLSKTVRTIIMARFYAPSSTGGLTYSKTGNSLFSVPLFSNGPLVLAPSTGTLNVNGINSTDPGAANTYTVNNPKLGNYNAYNLNVTTNSSATVGSGATVAGDLSVLSANSGNSAVVSVPGGTIDGRLTTNGIQSSNIQAPAGTNPGGNVLANADIPPGGTGSRLGLNATNPSLVSAANQYSIPPVPDVEGTPLPPLSDLSSPTSSIPITAGAYSSSGLDTSGVSAAIPIQNSSAPVQVYVQDNGTTQAVNVDTSKLAVQSSDARDLQVYYDGTNNVNINVNGTFNGLVYAPSAPVTISGNGTFNGAIVGGAVTVTMHGALNLYTDLTVNSASAPSVGVGSNWSPKDLANAYNANQNTGMLFLLNQSGILGWQPMTWQEIN